MSLISNTSLIFRPIPFRDEAQNESRIEGQAQTINFNIRY